MNNPDISVVNVTDVPTLIFSGTGKVAISNFSGNIRIGGSGVVYANNSTHFDIALGTMVEFKADAELYAIRDTGLSGNVRIQRWF